MRQSAAAAGIQTNVAQATMQRLLAGNQRYVAAQLNAQDTLKQQRTLLSQRQQPLAMILGCSDSRVPPEYIFDQGLGDLFVIRTAGHVLDEGTLGSLEFGVLELRIPVLVVLGHERCGAVQAAIAALNSGQMPAAHLATLITQIQPAIPPFQGNVDAQLDDAVQANVALTVQRLHQQPVLRDAIQSEHLTIVGARYDLDTGAVQWIVPSA